jgi:hypothetical protein
MNLIYLAKSISTQHRVYLKNIPNFIKTMEISLIPISKGIFGEDTDIGFGSLF